MKHGVWVLRTPATPDIQDVVELAVAAEESGWDGVFVSDSIAFRSTDPWVTLSAIAARTERVHLDHGSGAAAALAARPGTGVPRPAVGRTCAAGHRPWRR